MPKKRKVKDVIRTAANGERINYGHLMVGYVNGIPCLASREVLMVLGIRLTEEKVPEWFYTHGRLEVDFLSTVKYKIYTVKRSDLFKLGVLLSRNRRNVRCEDENDVTMTRHWYNGEVSMSITDPNDPDPFKLKEVQFKTRHRKVGKLGKFWLLVKRLFTKNEVVLDD